MGTFSGGASLGGSTCFDYFLQAHFDLYYGFFVLAASISKHLLEYISIYIYVYLCFNVLLMFAPPVKNLPLKQKRFTNKLPPPQGGAKTK